MATRPAYLTGPESLRARNERRNFWFCLLAAPITLGFVGTFFGGSFGLSQITLIVIGALVFVSFARGRLLGSSVRLGDGQLPEIHRTTEELASRLGIETPHVFVRDDTLTAIGAVGTSEPYSLILSSQYLEHLSHAELRFLIARELAHLAAGHARITSLLSASGRENPAVALVLGAWLRSTEYTADRVALALAPGLHDAMRAIAVTSFHAIGRRVDLGRLVDQQRDLEAEPALRLGEWSSSFPYATRRFLALHAYSETTEFATWRDRFEEPPQIEPTSEPEPELEPGLGIRRAGCASIGARLAAIGIDLLTMSAIFPFGSATHVVKLNGTPDPNDSRYTQWIFEHLQALNIFTHIGFLGFALVAYSTIMVALAGQTLGMMVMDLRVVTTAYERPNVIQAVWRYALATVTLATGFALAGTVLRVHPHDWLSRTRVIRTRAAPARPVAAAAQTTVT